MSILVNRRTRLITQGITGRAGRLHTESGRHYAYGTRCFVAGVTPGKAGTTIAGVPVFGSVREAKTATGATASIVYVPPTFAAAAICEAIDAELDLVICVTTGIPMADLQRVHARLRDSRTTLLGPNCPGIVTPGEINIGILPASFHASGRIGVISRTGAHGPDLLHRLAVSGLGLSTIVGIGGGFDAAASGGLGFVDVMKLFDADPGTDAVLMVDEVDSERRADGDAEETFAHWLRDHPHKPVAALIVGHGDEAERRAATMQRCGVTVAREATGMAALLGGLVAPECLPFD